MSAKVCGLIWDIGPQERIQRFVLLAIGDFAGDDGYCWPGIKTLARRTLFTPRYVMSAIRKLEEDGWLKVGRQTGRGSEYWIDIERLEVLNEERRARTREKSSRVGSEKSSRVRGKDTSEPVSGVVVKSKTPTSEIHDKTPTPPYKKNHQEPPVGTVNISTPSKPDPLEAIYQAYPRKEGKRVALLAIEKAIARIMAGERGEKESSRIIAARWLYAVVKQYGESPAGNRGNFTPHPATWFNQSRYLDNPAEWEREETFTHGAKQSVMHDNIAAGTRLIRRIEEGEADNPGTLDSLGLLPAAIGRGDAGGICETPLRPNLGAVTRNVRPSGEGVQVLPPSSGTSGTGGRRNPTLPF